MVSTLRDENVPFFVSSDSTGVQEFPRIRSLPSKSIQVTPSFCVHQHTMAATIRDDQITSVTVSNTCTWQQLVTLKVLNNYHEINVTLVVINIYIAN